MASIYRAHRTITQALLASSLIIGLFARRGLPADLHDALPVDGAPDALEEVVVTAQRRAEKLDQVPMSVTALSRNALDDLHIESFSDLGTVVPGLIVSNPGGGAQSRTDVAIRGIFSGGNSPTTGIYVDETPIAIRRMDAAGYAGSPRPDLYDLDRVEVLRGPQGTLFGSGAMGGVIRYITPQPNLEDASGNAKAEFAYTERGDPSYAVGVAYGSPIIRDELGFRLTGWFHSDGGFIDLEDPYSGDILQRNANSARSYVLRPAVTWAPTSALSFTPAVFIQNHHSDEPDEYWVTEMPSPENGAHVSGFGARARQPVQDDLTIPSLAIKYEFARASLQADTSFVDRTYRDVDDWSNILGPFFGLSPVAPALSSFSAYSENIASTHAWQQELRLSSRDPASRINWVVGAYFRRAREELTQSIAPDLSPITQLAYGAGSLQVFGVPDYVVNGQSYNSYSSFVTVDEQKALFGEISFDVATHLKANVGVRVERSTVEQQSETTAGPLQGTAYSSIVLPDQSQTPVTPRFGLTYQYTDSDMVYVSAAKGYRAGGSNSPNVTANSLCESSAKALGLSTVPASYDSDSLWSYELGAKDTFLDQRLSLQASIYYIDWSNIQTSVYLQSCGNTYEANRGKAISQGFDLQFAALLTEGLKVSGTVGYTDAYYPNAAFGAPVGGEAPLLNGAGDKLANVLPWTASAHLEYSHATDRMIVGSRSYVRLDYRWLDGGPKANPNVAGYDPAIGPYPDEAYRILNLRIGTAFYGIDLSAFLNNATNSNPLLSYSHLLAGDPLFTATAIRPRTAGLTALLKF